MRKKKAQLVITFASTTQAIQMEAFCRQEQLPGRMIPVPAQISAGCGLAWKTEPELKERYITRLNQAQILWEQMQIVDL